MRRVLPVAVAVLALCVSQLPAQALTPIGAGSATAAAAAPIRTKTDFLLSASAFGTQVRGGMLPADSGETGEAIIGCQRFVGKSKRNYVEETVIPGLGTVNGVRTRVWTEKVGNRVQSNSLHTIASIVLSDTPLGTLEVVGLESLSEAFNRNGKYGAKVTNTIARIRYTPPGGGSASTLPIPAPNAPVVIPGLLRLDVGIRRTGVTDTGAAALGNVLRITVEPSDSRIIIGSTRARIEDTKTTGLFNGYGAGVEAEVLGEVVRVGRTPNQILPCLGTDGEVQDTVVGSVDLDPLGVTGAAVGAVTARRDGKLAKATVVGQVADVSLLDGNLEIKLARGVATIFRDKTGKVTRSAVGSTIGEIIANGETYSLDPLEALTIPGLAELQARVVEKTRLSVKAIGLRVTLLDGSLAVIDLGVAKAAIKPRRR